MTIDHTTPIVIACDGACSGNPGPGGYGTIVQYPDGTEVSLAGNAAQTTNNRMELQGLIEGLKVVHGDSEAARAFSKHPIHVITDSDLTIKCAQGTWKRKSNVDLWKEYEQLPTTRKLTFQWVKGHNGHPLNERCDKLAVEQSQLAKRGKVSSTAVAVGTTAPVSVTKPVAVVQPEEPLTYPMYLSLLTSGKLQRHATWAECQGATSGVSGAKFKKVKDEYEAVATLQKWGVSVPTAQTKPVAAPVKLAKPKANYER